MISCDVIPSGLAGARTEGGGDPVGLLTDVAAVVEPDLSWSGGEVVVTFPEEEVGTPVSRAEAVVGTTGGATGTVTGTIEAGTPVADTETDMASSLLVLPLLK